MTHLHSNIAATPQTSSLDAGTQREGMPSQAGPLPPTGTPPATPLEDRWITQLPRRGKPNKQVDQQLHEAARRGGDVKEIRRLMEMGGNPSSPIGRNLGLRRKTTPMYELIQRINDKKQAAPADGHASLQAMLANPNTDRSIGKRSRVRGGEQTPIELAQGLGDQESIRLLTNVKATAREQAVDTGEPPSPRPGSPESASSLDVAAEEEAAFGTFDTFETFDRRPERPASRGMATFAQREAARDTAPDVPARPETRRGPVATTELPTSQASSSAASSSQIQPAGQGRTTGFVGPIRLPDDQPPRPRLTDRERAKGRDMLFDFNDRWIVDQLRDRVPLAELANFICELGTSEDLPDKVSPQGEALQPWLSTTLKKLLRNPGMKREHLSPKMIDLLERQRDRQAE